MSENVSKPHPQRIVATVQPFNSSNSENSSFHKAPYNTTLGLQESGVFDVDMLSQCTQTQDYEFANIASGEKSDLNVEIQKLNKFRKKIEECITPGVNLIATNSCDNQQQHLKFYKERLEQLENKILIYESSGDVQARRLTERLNRELQLESWVKQLTEQVNKLVDNNIQLEEERCELEEVENDTRLRLQNLEVDLEILTQRNLELQVCSNAHAYCLQETMNKANDRIYYLEEQRNDLKHKMEMITMCMPTILLYNTCKVQEYQQLSDHTDQLQIFTLPNVCSCIQSKTMTATEKQRLNALLSRERELQHNINELNRSYNEILESADNLWAVMENDYKEKLSEVEKENCVVKTKLVQLEDRLKGDVILAQERINQLEESEAELKSKINQKVREHKDELIKFEGITNELFVMHEEYEHLKDLYQSLLTRNMSVNITKKNHSLEEELQWINEHQREIEEQHTKNVKQLQDELNRLNIELMHINVSNGELKEEVITLENRVVELGEIKIQNEETIKNLTAELGNHRDELQKLTPKLDVNQISLAQELVLCNGDVNFALKKPKIAAKPNLEDLKINVKKVRTLRDGRDVN